MEFRTVGPAQLKDVDPAKGIFTGYASTFGVADDNNPPDIVEPGAFAKSIREWGPGGKNRIKCLFQHEPLLLIGRPLALREDEVGLYHETKLANTSTGRDVLQLLADGVLTEHSIGYDVIKAEYDQQGRRLLKELRLWEYSLVTWGMNSQTPVLAVKGTQPVVTLSERMARLEKALRSGRFESDEIPHLLELALHRYAEEVKALENETAESSAPYEVKTATRFADLPLAPRDRAWDSAAADQRVRAWAGGEQNMDWAKYRKAFFWYDSENPEQFGSYKLPFADVIDGELRAVPRAIFAAAAAVQGARGGVNIPASDVDGVKAHIARYYEKMRREFNDDSIIPPWEKGQKLIAAALETKAEDLAALATTLAEEQQRQELMRRVWDIQSALDTVMRNLLEDDTISADEKVAAFDVSLQQFRSLMLAAFSALAGLDASEQEQVAAAIGPSGRKVGRVLSRANRELIQQVVSMLQDLLAAADASEPAEDATPEGEQKASDGAGEPDEIHSLEEFVNSLKAEREKEIEAEVKRVLDLVRSVNTNG